jgi:acyl-CoA synthetase (AMP-forming)/AMP-acid ligase II
MHLIDFFDRGAALNPTADCLVQGQERMDYRTAARWTHCIAVTLQAAGLARGDRVALVSHNNIWSYLALLGLQRAGCVWVPLNARSSRSEWMLHLQRTDARLIFTSAEFRTQMDELAAELPQVVKVVTTDSGGADDMRAWESSDEDTHAPPRPTDDRGAIFRITSSGGTTGSPKAIIQTQAGVEANVATFLALAAHPHPRYLLCTPMSHAAGILSFPILALGGSIHFLHKPDPDKVMEVIERERITCVMLTPTSVYSLLDHPDVAARNFSSLKLCIFGAAPMSETRLRQALQVFGPVMMHLYAQTEASTMLTAMLPSDYEAMLASPNLSHRLGSCGKPTPLTQVAVMSAEGELLKPGERGEIVVRSAMVMAGYLGEDAASRQTRAHGWHHTGDVGYIDTDGYVYLVDRIRDVIISGGFNVFPSEVEQLLLAQPGVRDCAVVGVPDAKWGESVKAVIEAGPNEQPDIEALMRVCRSKLGGVKAPKSIDLWPELPRSHLGKVLKRTIRDHFRSLASEENTR